MSGVLTMAEVAARVGLSYGRFAKLRRAWQAQRGFPGPIGCLRWDAAAVEAWIRAASAGRLDAPRPPTADDTAARQRKAWAQLARLRAS